ncbi:hypothetical protein Tco_0948209, partial [Tanacetum coccineum]
KNLLVLIKPKWNATTAIKQGILQESVDQKKIIGGGMVGILEIEKVISWKLHSSSGVHTLMTNEGVVIHMLTEKKYPLKKEIVVQMLNLKLESEEESTMALELIRFIKKVLADLESKEQD